MSVSFREPHTEQEWEDYYDLRYRLLREPLDQPRGSERNDGDNKSDNKHVAMYIDDELKAIARIDQLDTEKVQYRFIAVDNKEQKKGYGRMIMQYCEDYSKRCGLKLAILHARDYALAFYEHIGYKTIEKSYCLYGVLQHFYMEKAL